MIGKLVGNRVSREDEVTGLDGPEMGVLAYPDNTPPRHIEDLSEDSRRVGGVAARVPG